MDEARRRRQKNGKVECWPRGKSSDGGGASLAAFCEPDVRLLSRSSAAVLFKCTFGAGRPRFSHLTELFSQEDLKWPGKTSLLCLHPLGRQRSKHWAKVMMINQEHATPEAVALKDCCTDHCP